MEDKEYIEFLKNSSEGFKDISIYSKKASECLDDLADYLSNPTELAFINDYMIKRKQNELFVYVALFNHRASTLVEFNEDMNNKFNKNGGEDELH